MVPRSFRLTGVTFIPNAQELIEKMVSVGQELFLIRDPGNIHDPNATKVSIKLSDAYVQIGWIPREYAVEVAPFLAAGGEIKMTVLHRQGGNGYNWGVTTYIESVKIPQTGKKLTQPQVKQITN